MYPALSEAAVTAGPCDGASAVSRLEAACARMTALAERTPSSHAHAFHRTVSAVHGICEALVECEGAGVPAADLRQVVAGARAIHGRSPFIRRLQCWPRGYAGDFETIEWLWRAENRGEDTLGWALERYALTASIAQQHRNKVVFQGACVLEAVRQRGPCRILSLACGSSPDLRSIAGLIPQDVEIVLCDSDAEALAFSEMKLHALRSRTRLVHGTIPRVLRPLRDLGPYDLVFAGGLFDYLPDRLVHRTLSTIWRSLLAPGGRMVFTNIALGNPFRVWLENLADWRLIERSEEDIRRICREAGIPAGVELTRDSTQLAILASVYNVPVEPGPDATREL